MQRVILYQAIKTLPDNFLPELAEFITFLQMKAQQKINVWARLSTNNDVKLQNDTLEKAAQTLFDDYMNDQELTAFTGLDGEDFYA
ncbi:hypothetical protein PN36_17365 [Candidatus Thiomargarita nelsonii]|uniref:DUF2281 domain-containing protein n=1 Tax=Candidatus Thiomargarita nelsonii TaxID=1003181 RepID=A0A0A6PC63_9GAMM|nr:hypothetical protein PN36_17365 [Candidatus Thiomargarita nelsonii]